MWIRIDSAIQDGARVLNFTMIELNKTSTRSLLRPLAAAVLMLQMTEYRLPEAHWFTFAPSVPNGRWFFSKLSSPIDITNVLKNGAPKICAHR